MKLPTKSGHRVHEGNPVDADSPVTDGRGNNHNAAL